MSPSARPAFLQPLPQINGKSKAEVLADHEDDRALACAATWRNFIRIAELDKLEVWRDAGCRDMVEWVSAHYDINSWKARRWVKAAHALAKLPAVSKAFATGELCIDKVVELTRFAALQDEERLIKWAIKVKVSTVRDRADIATRPDIDKTRDDDRALSLGWDWNEDKSLLHHWGAMPSLYGKAFTDKIDDLAKEIPISPEAVELFGEDAAEATLEARRAEALYLLVSGGSAGKTPRPKVVVHAELDALLADASGCELEGVGVMHPAIARRLLCDCELEFTVYAKDGNPLGIGKAAHDPPRWLRRMVKRRDKGCMFPGCSMTRFIQVHHIEFDGGKPRTDYDSLICLCHFHHKLVHEYGWRVKLGEIPGTADWFRPDGSSYLTRRGPPTPEHPASPEHEMVPIPLVNSGA